MGYGCQYSVVRRSFKRARACQHHDRLYSLIGVQTGADMVAAGYSRKLQFCVISFTINQMSLPHGELSVSSRVVILSFSRVTAVRFVNLETCNF